MDIKELRVGNYVRDCVESGGKIHQLTIHNFGSDKDGYSHYIDLCNPIPLTEEWLIKFGFTKEYYDEKNHKEGYTYTIVLPIIGELCQSDKKDYVFDIEQDKLRLKFVHQLQNLYFALTGTEMVYEK